MIVKAKEGDIKEISLCRFRAVEHLNSIAIMENCSIESIKDEFKEGEIFCFIENKKIAGTISLKNNQISGLYVHPDFKGKGIGKKLLQFAEKYSKKKGIKQLYLYAVFEAHTFYLKEGYKPKGIAISFEFKQPSRFVRMEKKI